MFCPKCGAVQNEGAVFCNVCGSRMNYAVQAQPTTNAPSESKAMQIVGFVLGLVSLVLCWVGVIPQVWALGILITLMAIAGIVLSSISLRQARNAGERKGLGIAGLVLAIVGVSLASIYTLVGGIVSTRIYY